MSPRRRRQFALAMALMVASGLGELAAIGTLVPFLSLLAGGARTEAVPAAALWFALAIVAANGLRLLLTVSSQRFVNGFGHDLSVEVQRRILWQPYAWHLDRNSSQALAALDKVQLLVSGGLLQLMQAVSAAVVAAFILAALLGIDPLATLAAATGVGGAYAAASLLLRQRLRRDSTLLNQAYERRIRQVQESLGGVRDMILDHSQEQHATAFRRLDRQIAEASTRITLASATPRFLIEAAGTIGIALIALLVARRDGGLAAAIPTLGALALGGLRLLPQVQQLYQGWSWLNGASAIAADVLDLLRLPLPADTPRPPPLPFRDRIVLDRVGFRFAERGETAVADVSLTIPKGARVAIVGRTGAGKSTLADLIMGLLTPTSGRISVDGTPLEGRARVAWQASLAHVPQSIFLADATIAENIAFGAGPVDPDRVRDAARTAQLDAFVGTLPRGYDTRVGERGVRLSGGQRQRLGIARAAYRRAPLLILDEPTSALDRGTEAAVIQAIEQLSGDGGTIIIIAHRLATIARCDLVVTLERGRIVRIEPGDQRSSAASVSAG